MTSPILQHRYRPGMSEAELQAADRMSNAVHEAGHAVAAVLLNQNLISVTINPERPHAAKRGNYAALLASQLGGTSAVPPADLPADPRDPYGGVKLEPGEIKIPNYFQALRQAAVSSLAGAAAQEHDSEDEDWLLDEYLETTSETDLQGLWENINATEGTEEEKAELEATWTRDARAFVSQHWHLIERVASALLERETLSGDDVYILLEPDLDAYFAELEAAA